MDIREENVQQLSMCLDIIDDVKDDIKKLQERVDNLYAVYDILFNLINIDK